MAEMLAEYLGPEGYIVHLRYTAQSGLETASLRGNDRLSGDSPGD